MNGVKTYTFIVLQPSYLKSWYQANDNIYITIYNDIYITIIYIVVDQATLPVKHTHKTGSTYRHNIPTKLVVYILLLTYGIRKTLHFRELNRFTSFELE